MDISSVYCRSPAFTTDGGIPNIFPLPPDILYNCPASIPTILIYF